MGTSEIAKEKVTLAVKKEIRTVPESTSSRMNPGVTGTKPASSSDWMGMGCAWALSCPGALDVGSVPGDLGDLAGLLNATDFIGDSLPAARHQP